MKYSVLLALCIILILLLASSLFYYVTTTTNTTEEPIPTNFSDFTEDVPTVSQSGAELSPDQAFIETPVVPSSENDISIRSIVMADAALIPDTANEGQFIVYGEATTCADEFNCQFPFSITYDQTTDFFTIVLYEVPLSTTRDRAKTVLMERFRVSAEVVCSLNYMVSTPFWVSERFAGVDLRFNGCSDAVQL